MSFENLPTQNKAFVIGSPIEQSKSPVLHNRAYQFLGLSNWNYSKREITLETLGDFINDVKNSEQIKGFSVTMPLKNAVIQYLDKISYDAQKSEAVNTVINNCGKLEGYNTDIYGIVNAIKDDNYDNDQFETGIILGSGATARSAYLALCELNIKQIYIISRSQLQSILNNAHSIKLDNMLDQKYANLFNKSDKKSVLISTLPWAPAKEVLNKLNLQYPQFFQNNHVLECAFPKFLNSSISGENMLIHQAIYQIKLMTKFEGIKLNLKNDSQSSELSSHNKSLSNQLFAELKDALKVS